MNLSIIEPYREKYPLIWKEYIEENVHQVVEEDVVGKAVLDIGANIGFVSMLHLALGARYTVAVEPHPSTFDIMKKLVAGHPIIPLQVAAYNGLTKRVNMTTEEGGNLGISKSVPGDGVQAWPLSRFLGYFDPDDNNLALKIDVEGSEYDVLLYASGQDIRRFQTIFLETHQAPHLPPHAARKYEYLKNYMSFLGYEVKNEEMVCMWEWINGKVVGCKEVEGNRSMKLKRIENWK